MIIKDLKHNEQLIGHIEYSIDAYYRKTLSLINLIDALYILVSNFREGSDEWKERMYSCINSMDTEYACMRSDNRTELTPIAFDRLTEDIVNIKSMIDEYKKEHPEGSGIDEEYEEYMRLYPDKESDLKP